MDFFVRMDVYDLSMFPSCYTRLLAEGVDAQLETYSIGIGKAYGLGLGIGIAYMYSVT
jgi:hypothetical protein